jgi:hypothetical protein
MHPDISFGHVQVQPRHSITSPQASVSLLNHYIIRFFLGKSSRKAFGSEQKEAPAVCRQPRGRRRLKNGMLMR